METKGVTAAVTAGGLAPLVLYVMVRVLGDNADDPLAQGAALAVAALLVGGGAAWAAWAKRSVSSVLSEGFDLEQVPAEAQRTVLAQAARLPHTPQVATRSSERPADMLGGDDHPGDPGGPHGPTGGPHVSQAPPDDYDDRGRYDPKRRNRP